MKALWESSALHKSIRIQELFAPCSPAQIVTVSSSSWRKQDGRTGDGDLGNVYAVDGAGGKPAPVGVTQCMQNCPVRPPHHLQNRLLQNNLKYDAAPRAACIMEDLDELIVVLPKPSCNLVSKL